MTPTRWAALMGALALGIFMMRMCATRSGDGTFGTGDFSACETEQVRLEFLDVPFPKQLASRLKGEGKINPNIKGWYGLYSKAINQIMGVGTRVDLQKARTTLAAAETAKRRKSKEKESVATYVASLARRLHPPGKSISKKSYEELVVIYKSYYLYTVACGLGSKEACSSRGEACKAFIDAQLARFKR